jgi:hypothetical protein
MRVSYLRSVCFLLPPHDPNPAAHRLRGQSQSKRVALPHQLNHAQSGRITPRYGLTCGPAASREMSILYHPDVRFITLMSGSYPESTMLMGRRFGRGTDSLEKSRSVCARTSAVAMK